MPTPEPDVIGLTQSRLDEAIATHSFYNPDVGALPHYIIMTPQELRGGHARDLIEWRHESHNGVATGLQRPQYKQYKIKTVGVCAPNKSLKITMLERGYTTPVIEDLGGDAYHLIRRLPIMTADAMQGCVADLRARIEPEVGNPGVWLRSGLIQYGAARTCGHKVCILPVRVVIAAESVPHYMACGVEVVGMSAAKEREFKDKAAELHIKPLATLDANTYLEAGS